MRRPGRLLRRLVATLAAALALAAGVGVARPARAQALMIAPTAVVTTDRARTGALTLINAGEQAAEVRLSAAYGYPVTDSAGAMTLRLTEPTGDSARSAVAWVRFFPERLTLAPGQRRTVRLLVSPPPGVADGEYWGRVVVAARRAAEPDAADQASQIGIGLALEVRSILALFYRHGRVVTGVGLDSVRTVQHGDSLAVRAQLTRRGTAAFVGSLRAALRDAQGGVRAEAALPLGVYYTLAPRLALATRGLPAGRYTLTVETVSARPDLPATAILQAVPERRTFGVTVP